MLERIGIYGWKLWWIFINPEWFKFYTPEVFKSGAKLFDSVTDGRIIQSSGYTAIFPQHSRRMIPISLP